MNDTKHRQLFCRPSKVVFRLNTPGRILSPGQMPWAGIGLAAMLLVAAVARPAFAVDAEPGAGPALVHFAFAKSLFADVNENDAKAAVKVYSQIIADEHSIRIGDGPSLLDGTNAMVKALQLGQVDLLSLPAEEFLALEDQGLEGPLILSSSRHAITEVYVLLVGERSAIREVEDLKGRSVIVSSDSRASLARIWLEVLCRERGLGPAEHVLSKVMPISKTTQVILPVFFGNVDACIATRSGWEVMCELNPQVKKQLRVVAESPPVVPIITCFRRGFPETLKRKAIKASEESVGKPAFNQLMALFKTDSLGEQPLSTLESTRQLVATYHRLCAAPEGTRPFAQKPGISPGSTGP